MLVEVAWAEAGGLEEDELKGEPMAQSVVFATRAAREAMKVMGRATPVEQVHMETVWMVVAVAAEGMVVEEMGKVIRLEESNSTLSHRHKQLGTRPQED